jgi:hypothetical protein
MLFNNHLNERYLAISFETSLTPKHCKICSPKSIYSPLFIVTYL